MFAGVSPGAGGEVGGVVLGGGGCYGGFAGAESTGAGWAGGGVDGGDRVGGGTAFVESG